eukprot:2928577-Amphidinium_carterae.2
MPAAMDQSVTAIPCGSPNFAQDFQAKNSTLLLAAAWKPVPPLHKRLAPSMLENIFPSYVSLSSLLLSFTYSEQYAPPLWAFGLRVDELVPLSSGTKRIKAPYSFPPTDAGLGFTSLRGDVVAHYIAQLLAVRYQHQEPNYK